MKKTAIIAFIVALGSFAAMTLITGDDVRTASERPIALDDCFTERTGPAEPVLCT